MNWRTVRKTDAHVHVIPDEIRQGDELKGSEFAYASMDHYLKQAEKYNVERCILMPASSGHLYYSDPDRTNAFHAELMKKYKGKVYAFSDLPHNAWDILENGAEVLERGVKDHGMRGLKIHPNNLHMKTDSLDFVPVLRKAAELSIPVAVHSNPSFSGFADDSDPNTVNHLLKCFPDVRFITCHMGGMKWQDAFSGCWYVDISGVLPAFVRLYGIDQTRRILHAFGAERLIFGTDFPQVMYTKPEDIFETYMDILDRMEFSDDEIGMIAHGNIEKLVSFE